MIDASTDSALQDLVLQTGPIGALIVVLGGLVRSWLTRILDQISSLQKEVHDVVRTRNETNLDVRDLIRRVDRLEGGSPRKELAP